MKQRRNDELNPPFANCQLQKILTSEKEWGFILKNSPAEPWQRFEVLACKEGGLPKFGTFSSFWPPEFQSGLDHKMKCIY